MTGKRIGYIRVSTTDQNPGRQLDGIPLDKKFIEYYTGKSGSVRPQLELLKDYIREDDTLFVHSVDRLARSSRDLLNLINFFLSKKVIVVFVGQNLTFNGNDDTPMAKFQLAIMGAFSELEREISLERQREGIARAKLAGKYKGGQPKLDADKKEELRHKIQNTRKTKAAIAKELKISRPTLYKYLKEIEK
jgi:DNA invertase Pin-like site-specific DNA recombinase